MPPVDNAVELELTAASGEQLDIFQSALQMFRYIIFSSIVIVYTP